MEEDNFLSKLETLCDELNYKHQKRTEAFALTAEYEEWRRTRIDPAVLESIGPALLAFIAYTRAEDQELTRRGDPRVVMSEPRMVDSEG